MPVYIMSDKVARPRMPRSHAVTTGSLVFVSVTPNAPDRRLDKGDFAAQMRQCMESLGTLLAEAGSSFDQVVKMNLFLARVREDSAVMNEIYSSYFDPDRLPIRTTVGVTLPNPDFLLELECVAER